MQFRDREEAGRRLAAELVARALIGDHPLVLALPRGGVPVAAPVASELAGELDVLVVRKLGLPGHSELAMGAVAAGGVRVLNEDIVRSFAVDPGVIEQVTERERAELDRRERLYRGEREPLNVVGREAVLVDDGLATGATMRVAVAALRAKGVARIIVAVPVAAPEVCRAVAQEADEAVCLETPEPFNAVGRWYREFPQTSDDEVRSLLQASLRQSRRLSQQHGVG
ncbi:MAG: phosphoribosyltransferase [Trueperaceae bacterium]